MNPVEFPASLVEDLRRFLGTDGDPAPVHSASLRESLAAELRRSAPRLLSLHIPKTAGLTFSRVLAEVYGESFYRSYWEITDCRGARVDALPAHARCVHGHMRLDLMRERFPGAALVTWVREPVQRVVSFYEYWKREPDWQHPLCRRLHDRKLPLLEFAAQDEARNEISRMFGGCSAVDFSFIGIFEELPASMDRFFRMFGLPAREISSTHRNPARQGLEYRIAPAEREAIAALNEADCALYRDCVASAANPTTAAPVDATNPPGKSARADASPTAPITLSENFARAAQRHLADREPLLRERSPAPDSLLPRWCHELRGAVETQLLQQGARLLSLRVPLAEPVGFQQLLAAIFGESFFLQQREITDCHGRVVPSVPEAARCVHGHIPAEALRLRMPGTKLLAWVRDPVERVAAHYRYWCETPDPANPVCRALHEYRWTLLEFARQETVRNETARCFGALRPADFAFIGFFDSVPESVDRLRDTLEATAIPLLAEYRNTPTASAPAELTASERAEIERLNAEDCALVDECRRLFGPVRGSIARS